MDNIAEVLVSGLSHDSGLAFIELADRVEGHLNSYAVDGADAYIIRSVIEKFLSIQLKRGDLKVSFPKFEKAESLEYLRFFIQTARNYRIERSAELASKRVEELLSVEDSLRDNTSFGIAQLNEEEKKIARDHILKAKEIVSESSLNSRKKNAILERLIEAERELETIGTRTDRFFTLMGDAAFVLGDMAEKAKPFTQEIREILKIVFRGRENTEGVRLPKADGQLLLPPSEG
jgi:hypothetical protein